MERKRGGRQRESCYQLHSKLYGSILITSLLPLAAPTEHTNPLESGLPHFHNSLHYSLNTLFSLCFPLFLCSFPCPLSPLKHRQISTTNFLVRPPCVYIKGRVTRVSYLPHTSAWRVQVQHTRAQTHLFFCPFLLIYFVYDCEKWISWVVLASCIGCHTLYC